MRDATFSFERRGDFKLKKITRRKQVPAGYFVQIKITLIDDKA